MSCFASLLFFFFNDAATTDIYTLSLHDALPISFSRRLHARIRKTRYMHKMRCLLINRRSLLLALISKHLILRSEERFSRNAETDLVCRLLLEKKNTNTAVAAADNHYIARLTMLQDRHS